MMLFTLECDPLVTLAARGRTPVKLRVSSAGGGSEAAVFSRPSINVKFAAPLHHTRGPTTTDAHTKGPSLRGI